MMVPEHLGKGVRSMLDRAKINRALFLAALVVECILVGMLIYGKITSDRLISLPLSAEETARYAAYRITLPDVEDRDPTVGEVLAYCTPAGTDRIGGTRYSSEALPQYLYKCAALRDVSDAADGELLYITYTTQDAERVDIILTDHEMSSSIYAEKTDTYYELSRDGSRKYPNFRHQARAKNLTRKAVPAGLLGIGLAYSVGLYVWRRRKGALDAGAV